MKNYQELLQDVLDNGEERDDRTGTGTISVFGRQIRFDLSKGFPAVTTKKLAWRSVKSELLWFISGNTSERKLRHYLHGNPNAEASTIWTANAEAPYWVDKAKFPGDLGRIYQAQWRDWRSIKKFEVNDDKVDVQVESVDQLKNLIDGLKNDPYSRRHILSAWNPGELDQMALPPCHVMSQYYISQSGKLSCHMYQRSGDIFLGVPFNIASYALLTHMLAQVTGYAPGELVMSFGDLHIYKNHVEQVKEQLSRAPLELPTLQLNSEVKNLFDFTMQDLNLIDYQSYGPIKANMAV